MPTKASRNRVFYYFWDSKVITTRPRTMETNAWLARSKSKSKKQLFHMQSTDPLNRKGRVTGINCVWLWSIFNKLSIEKNRLKKSLRTNENESTKENWRKMCFFVFFSKMKKKCQRRRFQKIGTLTYDVPRCWNFHSNLVHCWSFWDLKDFKKISLLCELFVSEDPNARSYHIHRRT